MPEQKCNHKNKKDFMKFSSTGFRHEFCPDCGWHRYKGKEYSKQEWFDTFVKEDGGDHA